MNYKVYIKQLYRAISRLFLAVFGCDPRLVLKLKFVTVWKVWGVSIYI